MLTHNLASQENSSLQRPKPERPTTGEPEWVAALKKPAAIFYLALTLLSSGCGDSVKEQFQKNPKPSVDDIIRNPEKWVNQAVALEGAVAFTSGTIETTTYKNHRRRVNGNDIWTLTQTAGDTTNHIYLSHTWEVRGVRDVTYPGLAETIRPYRLPSSTFAVTGTLRQSSHSNQLYLDVTGALYQ